MEEIEYTRDKVRLKLKELCSIIVTEIPTDESYGIYKQYNIMINEELHRCINSINSYLNCLLVNSRDKDLI